MTLYDYLKTTLEGTEVPVHDVDHPMESYFYNDEPDDSWSKSLHKFAELLEVRNVEGNHVTVDFSGLIRKRLDNIKETNLFITNTVEAIMADMPVILSGYVSEEWMEQFVNILSESEETKC